jgi:hypothetical protein
LLLIAAAFLSLFGSSCKGQQGEGEYGKAVTFDKDRAVKYPDFEIVYTGETSKTSTFPNGNSFTFKYQNFKVSKGRESKEIFWTSGTGVIEPANFEFGSGKFTLELRYTEGMKKKLADDEMVITKVN